MPVLILVGFRMGVFTATEIAGVAAAYSLIVGLFIYRTLHWSQLPKILLATAKETAVILLIVAAAVAVQLDPRHRAGAAADLRALTARPTTRG